MLIHFQKLLKLQERGGVKVKRSLNYFKMLPVCPWVSTSGFGRHKALT
jgi:hypothetical protein